MVKAKQNETIYMHFTVFDSDGITPLTGQAGSCTSSLRKDGASTAESVSISEIATTGRYYASFTPLAIASYDLEVTCPDDRVVGESYETEAADLDDIITEVNANETKIDAVQGDITNILADTNEMQGKLPTNNIMGSSVKTDKDDEIDAIKTKTDNLPADPASETNVDANETKIDALQSDITDILADTNEVQTKLPTNNIMGSSVKTDKDDEIDAIKAKTDNLPADPASESNIIAEQNKALVVFTATPLPNSIEIDAYDGLDISVGVTCEDINDASSIIQVAEITTPGIYQIRRIRSGAGSVLDTGNLVAGNGGAQYDYPFSSTDWQEGDIMEVIVGGLIVTRDGKTIHNSLFIASTNIVSDDLLTAIKAKTDNLPADPTAESNATTNTTNIISEIDDNETLINAIKAKTDNMPANLTNEILQILAYLGKNSVIEHSFNIQDAHEGFLMYCYDSKVNKQLHDKSTGLLYRLKMDVSYVGANPEITEMEDDLE